MKILALNSSDRLPTVAIAESAARKTNQNETVNRSNFCVDLAPIDVIYSTPTNSGAPSPAPAAKKITNSLAVEISAAMQSVNARPFDLGLIVVTTGPGSFSAIRQAVVTAKAMAYTTGCAIIGLNSTEVLAVQAANEIANEKKLTTGQALTVAVAMDAGRGEVYATEYCVSDGSAVLIDDPRLMKSEDWLVEVPSNSILTGSGFNLCDLRDDLVVASRVLRQVNAQTVARLGLTKFNESGSDDLWKLEPAYMRVSYAEEKLKSQ